MHSLDDPMIMREIIMDHYQNPRNHGLVDDDSYQKVNMDSSTCIDDIDVQAKFNGDVVEDVRFDGEACAICTASTSIMTELVKGKTKEEAAHIVDNYMHMIYEKEYDPELLDEAVIMKGVYKQPNRIKCATTGWHAMEQMIEESEEK